MGVDGRQLDIIKGMQVEKVVVFHLWFAVNSLII